MSNTLYGLPSACVAVDIYLYIPLFLIDVNINIVKKKKN